MMKRGSSLRRAEEMVAHSLLWSTRISKLYAGSCGVLQGIGPMLMISRRRPS